VKTHILIVILSDTNKYTEYMFSITVTNQPPRINSTIVSPVTLIFRETTTYNLPLSIDPEGLNYTTSIKNGPSFAKLISN
jgi:hypothetical protein